MNILGIILTLLSAIAYSTKAIFAKLIYQYGTSAETLLALRMLFSLPFFLVIGARSQFAERAAAAKPNLREHLQIVLLGILAFYVSAMLDFQGLRHISANLERIVVFSYPAMVVMLSALIFKIKISNIHRVALVATYIGLLITCGGEVHAHQENFILGVSLVLGCAFTYAVYLTFGEKLIIKFGPTFFTSYAMVSATGVIILRLVLAKSDEVLQQPKEVYAYALGMALLSTVIASLLMSEGIKRIGSSKAAILGTVGPISTIYLAHLILGESLSLQQALGGLIVVLGVVTLSQSR